MSEFDQKFGKGTLGREIVRNMEQITLDRIGGVALENAEKNRAAITRGNSLKKLRDEVVGTGDRAVIVAAGPSLRRTEVASKLKAHEFEGAVICADSSMYYCLRNGIVPDLVVTLDPHADRIVRWFGDPGLSRSDLEADDYFRRQDMDRAFADEMKINEEVCALLDEHGPKIRIAMSTSASTKVVGRAEDVGMQIYWWNPMYDDPEKSGSITRQLFDRNRLPCVNAGGNVGSACWMMASAVLGKKRIALTGIDLGYYDGTPYTNTQYYYELVDLVGEANLDTVYMRVYNPHIDQWFYTDPAYMWYRECLLEMIADSDSKTYNCTEGGILFGEDIAFIPLVEFLQMR